ncbi:trigger factor [Ferrimonas balearica DSM 9799]|uniref:Trigger factor n=1 Tax=Ferrimonas balearica (strain DSM 9799 / CCM 4581 / KCTC 23876 / PAT) TaxID=550540 RepID=E1SQ29_FERBD|nr:trigger factor [Ferrimonas balearica]MBY6017287.1 trigger factor [Halomonas denitrificans]ADN76801.1 trigger factor [Ferrimonas balearica DSM 9799]MBW3140213.1 trigger factor [Ferrimonas balearica]MBW3166222.1 trigger factor [Ferrimonas balearica]MBY5979903.1 trigger factor [Ferrimonas balearica]
MQVSVETTQGLERRMTITVAAADFEPKVQEEMKKEAKRVRLDGFRPGKVPVSVFKKRFGASIRAQVMGDVMQQSFFQAIVEQKINPAGMPKFEPLKNEEGADLEFAATFEVYPEVELQGLDAIEVEKPTCEVNDADVDAMLETLRKQHAEFKAVDREAGDNDRAKIDFTGSIDGEEFEGGKAEGFDLVIGSGRMIPGFEEGVKGHKAGDEFTIDVTFPEEYHAENLKGKAAQFAIKLTSVEEQVLPELNDEFVVKFGIAEGGVEALRAEVRKNMERELTQALKNAVKQQVIDGLVKANDIDMPQALINSEINVLRQQAMQRFGGMQGNNMPELPAELFQDEAKRRVQIGLLLGEVIKSQDLKVEEERVEALIASMASAYEDPQEVVDYYKGNQEMMQNMRNVALEEQAVEAILSGAKVTEKEVNFDEFMNQQR